MSSFRNLLARRDTSLEGSPTGHEQTRKVELALRSLNPSLARQQHQQSRGLSHRSSVPSFFSSSAASTKEVLRQRRVRRSPPLGLNAQHPAQLCSMMAVNSPTSPIATIIPGQNYLPLPSPLPLDLPFFPLATTPLPPPPATRMRRRFSLLSRKFGEALSPELVFDVDPTDGEPRKACDGIQKNTFPSVARATNEGEGDTCDLHISSEGMSEDYHRPSVQNAEGHLAQQKGTTWILEKNGQRITQYDYHEVLEFLRKL